MPYIDFLLNLSLPLLILGVFITLIVASEMGFWVGRLILRYFRQGNAEPMIDENVSTITNSSLALLALFLGFTFSSALDHFERNREAVIQESNAIATAYQFTVLQAEPYRTEVAEGIRNYLDIRLRIADLPNDRGAIRQLQMESQRQHKILWRSVARLMSHHPEAPLLEPLISSINSMVEAERTRTENLLNGVPNGLFVPVGLFLLFNGVLLGISLGEGAKRHVLLSWGLYLLVALAVGIIVDLDRPLKGFINVDQQAIQVLKQGMQ
jgi:hypothetical protein